MKKILFILLIVNGLFAQAQHFEVIQLDEFPTGTTQSVSAYCFDDTDSGIIVYGKNGCDSHWEIVDSANNIQELDNVDSIVLYNHQLPELYNITYTGCTTNLWLRIYIFTSPQSPFAEPTTWKRPNESITLECDGYDGMWSTGEVAESITVSAPGIYSVTLTNDCGSATYSVEVRDNVELYRATCDLLTNRNKVTWLTTPEQAEYVSAVKVYRNNVLVATVPYTDGLFTDDIGSDATQWQYHLVAVSVEGDDCPIPSYWKRTIHLDRIQDSQGNLILQWTPYEDEEPDKETVSAYSIYDIVGGEAHHVVDVGYFTNVYTYNPADFSGYGAVAAVFNNSKGLEDLAFSNRTKEMLLVDENLTGKMVVYPNPTNGEFTVEGVKDLTVFNTLGQTIATSHSENGTHRITVSSGIYFIKSDEGMVRKVVVE